MASPALLSRPSAHRFSSLRRTWCTGARPSSSTRCVRTTSTCFLPTPVCVCESPWLPEPRAPEWAGVWLAGPARWCSPGQLGPRSSSGLVQPCMAPLACALPAPMASRKGLRLPVPAGQWVLHGAPGGRSGALALTWGLIGAVVWGKHLGSVIAPILAHPPGCAPSCPPQAHGKGADA